MNKKLIKEQIRISAFNMSGSMGTDAIDYAWDRIEDYAKQTAIGFYKFIYLNDIELDASEEDRWWDNKNSKWLNDNDVYEQFLQSLNK
jgi:hypothetical protein